MHHARAGGAGGLGDRFRPLGLHRVKGLRAAFGQDANQVDGDAWESRIAASTEAG